MGEDNIQRTPKCVTRVCRFLGIWSYLIALFGSLAVLVFLLIFSRWCPWNFVKGLMSVYWTALPCLVGLSAACLQIAARGTMEQCIQNDLDKELARLDELKKMPDWFGQEPKKYDPDKAMKDYEDELERFCQRVKERQAKEANQEERG